MGLINKPVVWWQRASSLFRLAVVTSFLEASAGQEVGLLGERHVSGHCRTVEGVDFGSLGSLGAQPEGIQADAGGSLACERGSLDAGQQQYCGVCIQGVRFMWRLKGLSKWGTHTWNFIIQIKWPPMQTCLVLCNLTPCLLPLLYIYGKRNQV